MASPPKIVVLTGAGAWILTGSNPGLGMTLTIVGALAGFVLGAILLAGGCLWLALRQARKGRKNTTPAGGAVLEGEFVVIERGPSR